MKLFNLFKKKKSTPVAPVTSVKNHFNSETMNYTINNREYAIADSQLIKVQAVADDVHLYGWSLEVRYKMSGGEFCSWFTYWNHRVYATRSSALDAATKVYTSSSPGYEYRIVPLYKMTEPEYRDYKIDLLLTPNRVNKEPKVYEIKAWKVKEDIEKEIQRSQYPQNGKSMYKYKKNTMFIQMEDGNIRIVKNSTEPNSIIYTHARWTLDDLIKNDLVDEVNIQNEKWAHPHLCKELKKKIKK
jgi:hypothetical protein